MKKIVIYKMNGSCYRRKENRNIYLKFYNAGTVGGSNLNKKYEKTRR